MARRSAARRRGSIVAYGSRAEVAGWQTLAARAQSLVQGANAGRRRAKQRAIAILAAARPRSLTDTARDRLSVRLSEIRSALIHLRAHDDAETLAHAGELIQVCQGAGVRVTFERFAGRAVGAMIGDTIHLRGTENSRLILAGLRSAEVQLRDITHSELLVPAGGEAAGVKAPRMW